MVLSSNVLKFADDTKLYRTFANQEIAVIWTLFAGGLTGGSLQMLFDVSKCKVLRYGRMNTGIDPLYFMYDEPIDEVLWEKDLGVVSRKI